MIYCSHSGPAVGSAGPERDTIHRRFARTYRPLMPPDAADPRPFQAQTPMLRQYFQMAEDHPGVLIAMRVGDFYEFYGDHATRAASALEITLTGREDGSNGRIPMAGVPFHSVEKYLARLMQKGHRVALCEQLEDPKSAKGLVKRGITRVLTPGTLLEDSMLPQNQSAYLTAVCVQGDRTGLATLDLSTGEFVVTEVSREQAADLLAAELARLRPAELLVGPETESIEALGAGIGAATLAFQPPKPDRAQRLLLDHFRTATLDGFGLRDQPAAVVAASAVLTYAAQNQVSVDHVDSLQTYSVEAYLRIDPSTRRSLELTQNLGDGGRRYTLLSVLDLTVSSMGARLMRRWVEQPLRDARTIQNRQEAVGRLIAQPMVRADIRDGLRPIADLERLVSRVSTGTATPRDLGALRDSLRALQTLAEPLFRVGLGRIQELREEISDHEDLRHLLQNALAEELPLTLRDGGIIRPGFDPELDKLRDLSRNGKSYIAELEQKERERTGISQLKVGFNSVFGYYLEVSRTLSDRVPPEYIRKQTTANAERYITAELKDHESLVLGAQEKSTALESDLFHRVRQRVAGHAGSLLQTARALAELDTLAALAEVAVVRRYVRPDVLPEDHPHPVLSIRGGRHPVVEAETTAFVPNDLNIDDNERVLVITGPNMAGKSTYLRQIALIVAMAQMGSYVPAEAVSLRVCDRIFARIGAKDELALGQSTFMVEMVESAAILNHATEHSLVVLDEVGRGTSTFDGLSIAWAMVEHLADGGVPTLFATHYHQLNTLADQLANVRNYRVAVEERGEELVWTHRVLPGGADRSYGIHVARMAGVPRSVLRRATEILGQLEGERPVAAVSPRTQKLQLSLFEFEEPPVLQELRNLNLNGLTPLEALRLLDDWQRNLEKS